MRVVSGRGVNLDFNGFNVGLDSQSSSTDLIFLSHAHTDHLVRKARCPVLSSNLTADIALHRLGCDYNVVNSLPGVELLDSGHVLGGKSLLVRGDETVFYTGDFCPHDRFFLNGLRPVKCDTLIIESTYGSPQYVFDEPCDVLARARDVIEDDLARGFNVVLWGYAFGKAQVLTSLVGDLMPCAHPKVRGVNSVCRIHGFDVPETVELNGHQGFVYITPDRRELDRFPKSRVYSFTGWGARGVSDCFRLSDHACFTDLLRFVKACKPDQVLTHHGFSESFAQLLRLEGFNARAI